MKSSGINYYIDKIISYQRERNFASAYNMLQEAMAHYPSSEFLQTSEIYLLSRLGRLKEARDKAETRFSLLKDRSFFLSTYLEILLKQRDKKEILNLTERLRLSVVKDEKIYIRLVQILMRFGERERALELLDSALSSMPESKELNDFSVKLKGKSSDTTLSYYRERYKDITPDRAIQEIEAIMVLPEYERDISIRLFLAELYKKTGNLTKASEVYHDCLKIKDSLHVRKLLGFLYYKMADIDRAFFYLKDAFIDAPSDHALYATISKIIGKIKDTKEVETVLNEALSSHPEARQIYGLLRRFKKSSAQSMLK